MSSYVHYAYLAKFDSSVYEWDAINHWKWQANVSIACVKKVGGIGVHMWMWMVQWVEQNRYLRLNVGMMIPFESMFAVVCSRATC